MTAFLAATVTKDALEHPEKTACLVSPVFLALLANLECRDWTADLAFPEIWAFRDCVAHPDSRVPLENPENWECLDFLVRRVNRSPSYMKPVQG